MNDATKNMFQFQTANVATNLLSKDNLADNAAHFGAATKLPPGLNLNRASTTPLVRDSTRPSTTHLASEFSKPAVVPEGTRRRGR